MERRAGENVGDVRVLGLSSPRLEAAAPLAARAMPEPPTPGWSPPCTQLVMHTLNRRWLSAKSLGRPSSRAPAKPLNPDPVLAQQGLPLYLSFTGPRAGRTFESGVNTTVWRTGPRPTRSIGLPPPDPSLHHLPVQRPHHPFRPRRTHAPAHTASSARQRHGLSPFARPRLGRRRRRRR